MENNTLQQLKNLTLNEICTCNWKEKWPFLLSFKNDQLTLGHILLRYQSFLSIPVKTNANMEGSFECEKILLEIRHNLKESFKDYIILVTAPSKIIFKNHKFTSISIKYNRCDIEEKITDEQVLIVKKYLATLESAKKRGLAFNLTLSDMKRLMSRKTCFYTKRKFNNTLDHPDYPTLDRIDCNKGYVKGNVVVCTKFSNELKANLFEHRDVDIITIKRIIDTLTTLNVKT